MPPLELLRRVFSEDLSEQESLRCSRSLTIYDCLGKLGIDAAAADATALYIVGADSTGEGRDVPETIETFRPLCELILADLVQKGGGARTSACPEPAAPCSALAKALAALDAACEVSYSLTVSEAKDACAVQGTVASGTTSSSGLEAQAACPNLILHLVGPHVPAQLGGRVAEARFRAEGAALLLTLHFARELFPAFCAGAERRKEAFAPLGAAAAAAFYFNAGVWGYDSWLETLQLNLELPCPLVVTSYNAEEAEDDQDKMEEGLRNERWLWEPALNPFGSRVVRKTDYGEGKLGELRDNCISQCIALA